MGLLRKTKSEAEVDMSPMIDAVFLLLIFFLVSTMVKQRPEEIDVELPVSDSARKVKPEDDLVVIGVDKESRLHLEGRPSSLTELLDELGRIGAENPQQAIRLDTDRETPFERVAEVLSLLQFLDLQNVGIRTYDEEGSQ